MNTLRHIVRRPLIATILVFSTSLAGVSCGAGMEETPLQDEIGQTHRFEAYNEVVLEEEHVEVVDPDCRLQPRDDAYRAGEQLAIEVMHLEDEMMEVDTASAFLRMRMAARRDGVDLPINSGFRTMDEQEHLYHCYKTGSCNNGNLAARPGHSRHQSGRAVDISTGNGAVEWLDAHAASFGFHNPIRGREPWHWEYEPEQDLLLGEVDHCEALALDKAWKEATRRRG